jgi:hypothetical protein
VSRVGICQTDGVAAQSGEGRGWGGEGAYQVRDRNGRKDEGEVSTRDCTSRQAMMDNLQRSLAIAAHPANTEIELRSTGPFQRSESMMGQCLVICRATEGQDVAGGRAAACWLPADPLPDHCLMPSKHSLSRMHLVR